MSITLVTADDLEALRQEIAALADSVEGNLAETRAQVDALGQSAAKSDDVARLTERMALLEDTCRLIQVKHKSLEDLVFAEVARLEQAIRMPPYDVEVRVAEQPFRVSVLEPGVSHVTKDLTGMTFPGAKERARAAIAPAVMWHNVHMQAFGAGSIMPWDGTGVPPTTPSFGSLDTQMGHAASMGGKPTLTLYAVPWWMRGQTAFAGGVQTTTNLMSSQEFGADADKGRLRTDRIPHWQSLVRQVATRYLQPPYNCRVFQVGNELKGFYNRSRDGRGQAWDWDDYPGTPGAADLGYAAFYKLTVQAVLDAATAAGIPHGEVKIGGPYPVIAAQGALTSNSVPVGHPLRECVWGSANRQGVDAVAGFLDLQKAQGFKFDFLAIDFSTYLTDGAVPTADDFTVAYSRFSDYLRWARALLSDKGYGAEFPLVLSEWYCKPQMPVPAGNAPYRAALKALAYVAMLEQGVWIPLAWSPFGLGDGPNSGTDPNMWEGGLVTPTTSDTGGEPLPHLRVVAALREHFPPGTPLYAANPDSASVAALASDRACLLVNTTPGAVAVRVGAKVHDLGPYAVAVVERG